jgi:hypothetical protein
MADPTYYVCERCGHYWPEPEWPDRCEHCRAHGSSLIPCVDADVARERSEAIIAAKAEPVRPTKRNLMPSDQTEPRRQTAAERQHELAMAAVQRQAAPPEHSLGLTRNAKQQVQIDLTVRGHSLADVEAEAVALFDRLLAKYPNADEGAA